MRPRINFQHPLVEMTKKKSFLIRILGLFVLSLLISFFVETILTNHEPAQGGRVTANISQVKSYEAQLTVFRDFYHAVAGDIENTASIPGCDTNCNPASAFSNDGIIGSLDFTKTLKNSIVKTTVPAKSAADETVLFWQHLSKADMISGITDAGLKDGQPFVWGETHPAARAGGGFIVGSSDGTPFPFSPFSNGIRGIIVVQESVPDGSIPLDAEGKQPLSPARAAQIDRKMDDGRPNSGFVQAYGAPGCFLVDAEKKRVDYNEDNKKRDCGLIYKIGDLPDTKNLP